MFQDYSVKYNDAAENKINEIFEQTGIMPNSRMMNIGISPKRDFIFFEVTRIDTKRLEKFIQEMPESIRKKQALELLAHLKRGAYQGSGAYNGFVSTHPI